MLDRNGPAAGGAAARAGDRICGDARSDIAFTGVMQAAPWPWRRLDEVLRVVIGRLGIVPGAQ